MISPWWALYCSSDLCVQKKKPPRVELNLTLMTKFKRSEPNYCLCLGL
ncbi:hypothetical protein NC652_015010 [Populus alba x Populus x berolinensis]|nr:hypothetical protein NC652_015010 [Populus alba x Populus x berolinensis]